MSEEFDHPQAKEHKTQIKGHIDTSDSRAVYSKDGVKMSYSKDTQANVEETKPKGAEMTQDVGKVGVAQGSPRHRFTWRTVDLMVATVLAVALGLVFLFWNSAGYGLLVFLNGFTPGIGSLANGIWLLGGVVGASIIRKPGAAIYVEVLASVMEMAFGTAWGIRPLLSGAIEGLGAEVAVALFAYRRFGPLVLALAGVLSALGGCIAYLPYNLAKGFGYLSIYWSCFMISGLVLAGILGWVLSVLLAKAGVLRRFEIGRKNLPQV